MKKDKKKNQTIKWKKKSKMIVDNNHHKNPLNLDIK